MFQNTNKYAGMHPHTQAGWQAGRHAYTYVRIYARFSILVSKISDNSSIFLLEEKFSFFILVYFDVFSDGVSKIAKALQLQKTVI